MELSFHMFLCQDNDAVDTLAKMGSWLESSSRSRISYWSKWRQKRKAKMKIQSTTHNLIIKPDWTQSYLNYLLGLRETQSHGTKAYSFVWILEESGWFGGMLEKFVREKHCSGWKNKRLRLYVCCFVFSWLPPLLRKHVRFTTSARDTSQY